jgi:hypothetical protein
MQWVQLRLTLSSKIYQATDRYSRKHPARALLGHDLSSVCRRWVTLRAERHSSLPKSSHRSRKRNPGLDESL